MNDTFVNLDNARVDTQRDVMEKIKNAGDCPFCLKNIKKYHTKPILKETEWWLATESAYPYEGTKHHFLFILKSHGESLVDITPAAGADLMELLQWLETQYKIESGALALRFGDIRYNGASVKHLHVHVVIGDVHDPNHEKIRFKMSVPAKDVQSND